MVAGKRSAHLAVLCAVLALGVASAGCTVQDRPPAEAFFVVADAGEAQVLNAGTGVPLAFPENRTIEAESGAPPHEEVAYAWTASWGATGTAAEFFAHPPTPGLGLVELNVTAKDRTASDAVGLLVIPGGAAGSGRMYLGLVGGADLGDLPGSPVLVRQSVRAGAHEGSSYDAARPASGPARFALVPRALAASPEVVVLIGVKEGIGLIHRNSSLALALTPSRNYTLVVDTTAAQQHRVEAHDSSGALVESLSLSAFAAAHPGADEARVLVAPPAQTLPGFEAWGTATAVVGVALVALSRRR